jgi:hypothetical protein
MYLVTDGYEGYNALSESPGILGHGACWAHYPESRFIWSHSYSQRRGKEEGALGLRIKSGNSRVRS